MLKLLCISILTYSLLFIKKIYLKANTLLNNINGVV